MDNYLKANPGKNGFFCVFRKTYILRSDGRTPYDGFVLPVNETTLWRADKVFGHLFEVTTWGTLVYHGQFQDNDKEFVSYWSQNSALKEVKAPTSDDETHAFFSMMPAENTQSKSEFLMLLEAMPLVVSTARRSLQQVTRGQVVSLMIAKGSESTKLTEAGKDSGTWKRLFGLPGYKLYPNCMNFITGCNYEVLLLLYINFPKLIAQIVASENCQPQHIYKHICQADDILVKFYEYFEDKSKTYYFNYSYPSIKLRIPPIEYKDQGWMYTELPGMEVLVS
ncbi:hypothetical protein AA313_de0209878 [Arthrobotrys entomopaga]|nr:hypothetical protein AA313_de0209878 [Arthrobotrys entomopaga]